MTYAKILKGEALTPEEVQKANPKGINQYTKGGGGAADSSGDSKVDGHLNSLKVGQTVQFSQKDKDGEEGETLHITRQSKDRYYAQAGGSDKGGSLKDVKGWLKKNGNTLTHEGTGKMNDDGDLVPAKKSAALGLQQQL
jgi:hypothetical protein